MDVLAFSLKPMLTLQISWTCQIMTPKLPCNTTVVQKCALWWKIFRVGQLRMLPVHSLVSCETWPKRFVHYQWNLCWGRRYRLGVLPTCANNGKEILRQMSMRASLARIPLLLFTCCLLLLREGFCMSDPPALWSPPQILLASHQIRRLPVIFAD